jgi:hypothetical protein
VNAARQCHSHRQMRGYRCSGRPGDYATP